MSSLRLGTYAVFLFYYKSWGRVKNPLSAPLLDQTLHLRQASTLARRSARKASVSGLSE